MRAFLLAAGLGTRLRPWTDSTPKCLVPVAGRPLLAYWLEVLDRHGVRDVLINTHYLAEQVEEFARAYTGPIRIDLAHEPELLGSAGTLRVNCDFVGGEEDFLVAYADTLIHADLRRLVSMRRQTETVAALGLFRTPNPRQSGIAVVDQHGVIREFEEKPASPKSDLAFAGVLAASPELIDAIPDRVPCDLGGGVLRHLAGRLAGLELEGYVRDIGTPEALARAQAEVPDIWSSHQ